MPSRGRSAGLATHVANIPTWVGHSVTRDELDIFPGGKPIGNAAAAASTAELLATFDRNVADARAVIAVASDEHLYKPWSLQRHGQHIFTKPRVAELRTYDMNHLNHHRAQLGVYLRINDVPVPGMYGPSADEGDVSARGD